MSANKASYTRKESVTLTASVSVNSSPVANAAVTFTVTRSNSSKLTLSATTNASGVASTSFRLNNGKDPAGVYQVRADAALNSTVSGSGTTSFAVQ